MPLTRWAAVAGTVTLGAVWLRSWPVTATPSFMAHMTAHMLVVGLAAPLLAFAAWPVVASHTRRQWLSPVPASLVELVVVWLWHTPRLHHAARVDALAYVGEQASFLAAGLIFWLAVWTAALADRGRDVGSALLGLLVTLAHMTLLGALIALSPRPLFGHGTGAIVDQERGGVLMIVASAFVYIGVAVGLARRVLHPAWHSVKGTP